MTPASVIGSARMAPAIDGNRSMSLRKKTGRPDGDLLGVDLGEGAPRHVVVGGVGALLGGVGGLSASGAALLGPFHSLQGVSHSRFGIEPRGGCLCDPGGKSRIGGEGIFDLRSMRQKNSGSSLATQ
jgi:hypothetical protein